MLDFINRWRYGKQYGYEILFKRQPQRPEGKTGVLIGDMGVPETYEFEFYAGYMEHVFHYMLPPVIRDLVLADRGIALLDPEQPLAREPFKPRQLIDAHGSFTNRAGRPYVECPVTWRPPGTPKNPWDNGYFLYKEEGHSGQPDICEKTGAKVVGWYYGKLIPEKKVAWRHQIRRVYDEAVTALQSRYPETPFRLVYYVSPASLRQGIEDLLAEGCQTIIYQGITNPVYSDFEEYNYVLPLLHQFNAGRARLICADQLGNQPDLHQAYLHLLQDQLAHLPPAASLCLILSCHGHPFKKETQDLRHKEYQQPLEKEMRRLLQARGGRWTIVWSDDEYADPYWDPKRTKRETLTAYEEAIAQGYDYALEIPTEFIAENTDLMIFHAMKKFIAFPDYNREAPVPYPDWERPLTRTFHAGKTTGIYAGCPVGPYRRHVVAAVVNSLSPWLEK